MLRYINFGALCLGFLKVSQLFAKYRGDDSAEDYASSIQIIEGLMIFLTYGLILSFGVVGIKKAVVKARDMDAAEIKAKIKSIRSSRGGLGAQKQKPAAEVALSEGGINAAPPDATTTHAESSGAAVLSQV